MALRLFCIAKDIVIFVLAISGVMQDLLPAAD